ncbi:hypothetical protein AMK59_6666 [Oryctes borbonicus]|uniref:Tc1-like transposase DDE domain-containing protein n=1 Tax=Oryctes borbonicus TaxID=1629725 RepID=A0A0T6AT92_9SCAR|nr:hypothetical protein AMK59_6666 [Oryctes borbonicus]
MHRLRGSIKVKRRGNLTPVSCCSTTMHPRVKTLKAAVVCGFREIDYPPFSPVLVPSDNFFLPNHKKNTKGATFMDEDEFIAVDERYFANKPKEFVYNELEMLLKRCNKTCNAYISIFFFMLSSGI